MTSVFARPDKSQAEVTGIFFLLAQEYPKEK
jgi:hypothetical protein